MYNFCGDLERNIPNLMPPNTLSKIIMGNSVHLIPACYNIICSIFALKCLKTRRTFTIFIFYWVTLHYAKSFRQCSNPAMKSVVLFKAKVLHLVACGFNFQERVKEWERERESVLTKRNMSKTLACLWTFVPEIFKDNCGCLKMKTHTPHMSCV